MTPRLAVDMVSFATMIRTNLPLLAAMIALASSGCAPEVAAARRSHDQVDAGNAANAAAASLLPVPLPSARHGHRIERLHGGLLCCGGFDGGDDRGMHDTLWLGPGATQWQQRARMNVGRAFFASVVVDDVLYAIGEGVERYDFAADRWTAIVAPGSLPRSHFTAAAVGHSAYVLGGYPVELSHLFAVDLDLGVVRRREPPPSFGPGDHLHLTATIAGVLHVIGGIDGDTFQLHTEHWSLRAEGWREEPAAPVGMWAKFAALAVVGERLFAFGDFGGFCYDDRRRSWSPRAKMPLELVLPATVPLGDSLWLIGGMRVDEAKRAVLLEYDLAGDVFHDRVTGS